MACGLLIKEDGERLFLMNALYGAGQKRGDAQDVKLVAGLLVGLLRDRIGDINFL